MPLMKGDYLTWTEFMPGGIDKPGRGHVVDMWRSGSGMLTECSLLEVRVIFCKVEGSTAVVGVCPERVLTINGLPKPPDWETRYKVRQREIRG